MLSSRAGLETIKSQPEEDLRCKSDGPDTSASSRGTHHEDKFDARIEHNGKVLFGTNPNFKSKQEALAWAKRLIEVVKGMSETKLREIDSLKLYYLAGGS